MNLFCLSCFQHVSVAHHQIWGLLTSDIQVRSCVSIHTRENVYIAAKSLSLWGRSWMLCLDLIWKVLSVLCTLMCTWQLWVSEPLQPPLSPSSYLPHSGSTRIFPFCLTVTLISDLVQGQKIFRKHLRVWDSGSGEQGNSKDVLFTREAYHLDVSSTKASGRRGGKGQTRGIRGWGLSVPLPGLLLEHFQERKIHLNRN